MFRLLCGLASAAALAAMLAACGAGPTDGTSEPRRPNIVLYVVDTVRADRLGVYGYEKPTSPRLDAFAAGAVLFENAYAQSSWTRPAVASLFTGLLPPAHRTVGRRSVLPEDALTLAEILAANGYEGMGLVRNPNVSRTFGFAQGFARFRSEDRERDETMLDRVRPWLDGRQNAEGPFFLFLHAIDPHGPYDPAPEFEEMFEAGGAPEHYRTVRYLLRLNRGEVEPEPGTAEALSRLYDAEVAQNDRAFGELLDELGARGMDEDTAVIYVSDHGEEFQEHGRWEHGLSLYEEVLRIPLVMRLPGVPPRRVEAPGGRPPGCGGADARPAGRAEPRRRNRIRRRDRGRPARRERTPAAQGARLRGLSETLRRQVAQTPCQEFDAMADPADGGAGIGQTQERNVVLRCVVGGTVAVGEPPLLGHVEQCGSVGFLRQADPQEHGAGRLAPGADAAQLLGECGKQRVTLR